MRLHIWEELLLWDLFPGWHKKGKKSFPLFLRVGRMNEAVVSI